MNWYERFLLPRLIDCACGMGAVMKERASLIPQARGRVLEIGIGSGLNLRYYDSAHVDTIHGLDPAPDMQRLARRRAAEINIPVEHLTLSAEAIPEENRSFDTVVCTFTLCTIPDADKALREMHRVLKPEGQLLFCEHGAAPDAGVKRWQDRLTPLWKPLAGGCHLNRPVARLLADGGFDVRDLTERYLPGPRPMTYVSRGRAVPYSEGVPPARERLTQ